MQLHEILKQFELLTTSIPETQNDHHEIFWTTSAGRRAVPTLQLQHSKRVLLCHLLSAQEGLPHAWSSSDSFNQVAEHPKGCSSHSVRHL